MAMYCSGLALFTLFDVSVASLYSSFDDASATSVFSKGVAAGTPVYSAKQAISAGAGYWSSAGATDDVVSWTGVLSSPRQISGVRLAWVHSPGEFKILVSSDGANFRASTPWSQPVRNDASFVDNVMFEPTSAKVVSVIMRRPRAWGYFGLSHVSVIAEPSPAMFVSGVTSPGGSQCLVTSATRRQFSLAPCLDAIAAGKGEELFTLSEEGILSSAMEPDLCAAVADGAAGGELVLGSCRAPGVATFEFSPSNQLKLPKLGNYCLSIQGDPLPKYITLTDAAAASSKRGGSTDLTMSLGKGASVASITVDWELAPRRFELALSSGGAFTTLVSLNENTLNTTVLAVGGVFGRTLRVRAASGYRIKSLSVMASAAKLVVDDCDDAGHSADARDKMFMVGVPALDPSLASATSGIASMAIKAGSRLGGLKAALLASLQKLDSCTFVNHRACIGNCTKDPRVRLSEGNSANVKVRRNVDRSVASKKVMTITRHRDADVETLSSLIVAARGAITLVRSRLGAK